MPLVWMLLLVVTFSHWTVAVQVGLPCIEIIVLFGTQMTRTCSQVCPTKLGGYPDCKIFLEGILMLTWIGVLLPQIICLDYADKVALLEFSCQFQH